MSSVLHRVGHLVNIGRTVVRCSKKMKDSAVVPHVVSGRVQLDFSDVSDEPMDTLCVFP